MVVSAGQGTGGVQTPEPSATTTASNPNALSQLVTALTGQSAQQSAQAGVADAAAMQQAGLAASQIGLGAETQQVNYGYGLLQGYNQYQQNQLQQQGQAQQMGTSAQQQALELEQYLGQQQGNKLTEAQTANQSAELAYNYPLQQQQLAGQEGAQGATNTVGAKQATAQLAATSGPQGFQQQALGLTQAQNVLNSQMAAVGQQSELAGYKGTQEQQANAEQQLQLAAQSNGISVAQLKTQMAVAAQQLGVQFDPTQSIIAASTAQGSAAQGVAASMGGIATLAGLSPQTFSSLTKK
jgi:hypothetical protein